MDEFIKVITDPSTVLSILALFFTLYSFWWMNWRRGKLHVSSPRSGTIHCPTTGNMLVKLPFSFFNDGPLPIVISNLRLVLIGEKIQPLVFMATMSSITGTGDRVMATQIPIAGRQAILTVYEFQRYVEDLALEAKSYNVELQAKTEDDGKWKVLLKFRLFISPELLSNARKNLLTFDNDEAEYKKF